MTYPSKRNRRDSAMRAKTMAGRLAVLDAFAAGDRVRWGERHTGEVIEIAGDAAAVSDGKRKWLINTKDLERA